MNLSANQKKQQMGKIHVGLAIVDNKTIKLFHKKYLQQNTPTDVLSFESQKQLPEGHYLLGDVMVSAERVKEQARQYHTTEAEELARVISHGILHLLGYDDQTPSEQKKMRQAEDKILNRLPKYTKK